MSDSPPHGRTAEPDLTAVLRLTVQLQTALQEADVPALRTIIAQLLELRAPLGDQWTALAQIAADIAELELARRALDLYVELAGRTDTALYRKATVLAHAGAWHEAEAALRAVPASVPNALAHAYSRGVAALNLGRIDEARRYLEQVTAARPQTGPAWLCIAMATDFAREPALTERLIAAERGPADGPADERAALSYALGKAYADNGEHHLAWQSFARGAQYMKAGVRYDRSADQEAAEAAVRDFTADRIAALADRQSVPTARTIFVTGLPRSGTTLIEQVLTAHSAVSGGAEIGALGVLAREHGGGAYRALVHHVDAGAAGAAAQLWHRWLGERFPAPGRVVDKSVDTSRYLGMVAALLPEAPLVWVTRDPLDRAWSCFRTNFMGGAIPWSYDLADIAAHFRIEDALLAQWQAMLGDRILVVPYEGFVHEPEAWIRRILAHCGLPEEPRVFTPHENRRPVATASVMQVRRPINRDAVGSAEPYRAFLAPFVEAYYG